MNKIKQFLTILSVLTVLGGIFFSTVFNTAEAQTANLEYVLETENKAFSPGETFNVDLKINNPLQQTIKTVGAKINYSTSHFSINQSNISISNAFDLTVEKNASGGIILITAGTTTTDINSNITVATIPFTVTSNAPRGVTQLVFVEDPNNSDTSILGADGTTELLDTATDLDIVISEIGISISPSSGDLNQGDDITLTFQISNPEGKDIVTADMEIDYDTSIFDFIQIGRAHV